MLSQDHLFWPCFSTFLIDKLFFSQVSCCAGQGRVEFLSISPSTAFSCQGTAPPYQVLQHLDLSNTDVTRLENRADSLFFSLVKQLSHFSHDKYFHLLGMLWGLGVCEGIHKTVNKEDKCKIIANRGRLSQISLQSPLSLGTAAPSSFTRWTWIVVLFL